MVRDETLQGRGHTGRRPPPRREANLDTHRRLIAETAADGCDLVVFPLKKRRPDTYEELTARL